MKYPVFAIFLILMLAGNLFAFYKLWSDKHEFLSRFPAVTETAFIFFRFLPLLNILALTGLWFFKPWAAWLAISAGILVIAFDWYYQIRYHLPVAIISTAMLLFFVIWYWNAFK